MDELSNELPPPEESTKLPPPEESNKLPPPEESTKLPLLEESNKLPLLEESNKLPLPEESNKLPLILMGVALVAMFAVGLIAGFLGRPLVLQDVPVQVVVTVIPPENPQSVAQGNVPPTTAATPQEPSDTAQSAASADNPAASTQPTPTIMDFLLSDARHFQGSAEAPITLIEFSDFK